MVGKNPESLVILRNQVLDINGISVTLLSGMGEGGGNIPMIIVRKSNEKK